MIIRSVLLSMLFLFLGSCTNKELDVDRIKQNFDIEKEYQLATDALENKNYGTAADLFENVYIYGYGSSLSLNALLMQAYSLFLNKQYLVAEDILDSYLSLNPTSEFVDYVYYLQALCFFSLVKGTVYDLSVAKQAKNKFQRLLAQFPNTKYSHAAKLYIALLDELFADKEMLVGVYYLTHLNPIAALKRFQNVYNIYSHTSKFEESIYRIMESFVSLGLMKEAKEFYQILSDKYPQGYWHKWATKEWATKYFA